MFTQGATSTNTTKKPAGKMKLEFLENRSSFLGYNLIQAHFWDFLEIACWYWPDFAIIQASIY